MRNTYTKLRKKSNPPLFYRFFYVFEFRFRKKTIRRHEIPTDCRRTKISTVLHTNRPTECVNPSNKRIEAIRLCTKFASELIKKPDSGTARAVRTVPQHA